jgi:beta-glucosidase
MRINLACLTLAFVMLASSGPVADQSAGLPAVEKRIDALLARMTLEEKVGQMTQHTRGDNPADLRDLVRAGRLGSIMNVTDPKEIAELQTLARSSRSGIPVLFGLDVIHGYRTIFPVPLAEASSWDPDLALRDAEVAAREATSVGIHWTFAPMADIARDPRWGRVMEGAGEDPFLGSAMAAARVKGFHAGGLAACVKHFVGYGAAEAGRDYNGADIPESTLREIYLPPFRAAVRAGADTLMSAFLSLNGVPATANRHTLTEVLRREWGFRGFVVSDWASVRELIAHGVAADEAEAARLALEAGVDMDMEGRVYERALPDLVGRGVVPLSRIDQAVRGILRVKFERGLFEKDAGGTPAPLPEAKTPLLTSESRNAARRAARESMVLLRNDGGVLPLVAGLKRIAIVGPLADAAGDQIGEWAATGRAEDATTIVQGVRQRARPGTDVVVARGCDISGSSTDGFADALERARSSDVVIAVLGESARMTGEAASRATLGLPGVQQGLLEALVGTGKPVVLVLLNGRPLAIPWAAEHVPAILEAWLPGTEGGPAVADILFGDANPSGKLPVTFPRSVGQVPIYYNHRPTGRPASERDRYSSKYLDEGVEPLYPFGFGLSYTRFAYRDLTITRNRIPANGSLDVTVRVRNAGNVPGREVVQLYVRDLVASRSRPVRELKGFRKILLEPGQEEVVRFTVPASELGFYTESGKYVVEPGAFKVLVGGSSLADLEATFEVTATPTRGR